MREIVKVRKVGDSLVVTLPKVVRDEFVVKAGDRLMLQTVDVPPGSRPFKVVVGRGLYITKE